MDKLQPWLRWLAAAGAVGILAVAFLVPHHEVPSAADADQSSPPPIALPAPSLEPSPQASPAKYAVYVCGAVRRCGVYRLAADARVDDAVSAAGGLTKDADPEAINLAAPLVDGLKVDVPKKGAPLVDCVGMTSSDAPGDGDSHRSSSHHRGSGRSGSHKLQPGQSLDINTASESELTQLPGVGPSLARRIVEYREANGPFQSVDDLQNVSGIGPSKFAKMEPYIRL